MEKIQEIEVKKIKSNPKDPRILMREDVIETIRIGITESGFHKSHALMVYPNKENFILISGHHRLEAAKRAELKTIPCWIREDLSEDEIYILLLTENAQGELSPLEIGIHALEIPHKRGKEGKLTEYARTINKTIGYISQMRGAAEVFKSLKLPKSQTVLLINKAPQLSKIHNLEIIEENENEEYTQESIWETAVKKFLIKPEEKVLNINDIEKQIKQALQCKTYFHDLKRYDLEQEWEEWNIETDPLEIKELQIKRDELEARNYEGWNVEIGDIKDYETKEKFDFIITDPPYKKEYLGLYEILAIRSIEWLKDDGLLIVMCGQSYFSEIIMLMTKHLQYYWIGCYLTPGQPTPLRQKQINASWKPLLIFSKIDAEYKGKTFGDVFKSDQNEKDFHEWGQSISGMTSIVSQICKPEQTIFDPFCGSGTTGIAAIKCGCYFHGIDIDPDNVRLTKKRLNKET